MPAVNLAKHAQRVLLLIEATLHSPEFEKHSLAESMYRRLPSRTIMSTLGASKFTRKGSEFCLSFIDQRILTVHMLDLDVKIYFNKICYTVQKVLTVSFGSLS